MSELLGAIAIGASGQSCTVIGVAGDRLTLHCPDGLKVVSRSAVVRFERTQSPNPVPVEPDPYPIGTRLLLREWLEFLDGRPPKWWTIVSYRPENGIYGLDADDGHVACLDRKLIERDSVEHTL